MSAEKLEELLEDHMFLETDAKTIEGAISCAATADNMTDYIANLEEARIAVVSLLKLIDEALASAKGAT